MGKNNDTPVHLRLPDFQTNPNSGFQYLPKKTRLLMLLLNQVVFHFPSICLSPKCLKQVLQVFGLLENLKGCGLFGNSFPWFSPDDKSDGAPILHQIMRKNPVQRTFPTMDETFVFWQFSQVFGPKKTMGTSFRPRHGIGVVEQRNGQGMAFTQKSLRHLRSMESMAPHLRAHTCV